MKMLIWLGFFLTFCILRGSCFSYELGKIYSYTYVTEVRINEAVPTGGDVGFKLSALVDLSVVWQSGSEQLTRIRFHDVQLSKVGERQPDEDTFSSPPTTLVVVSSQPGYFVWSRGEVTAIYLSDGESEGSADVKRGLIGLLQMQSTQGVVTEHDASGECQVMYTSFDDKILKLKDPASCKAAKPAGGYSHQKRGFGIDVQSEASSSCTLSTDGAVIIQSAVGFESWKTYVNLRSELSTAVNTRQNLDLQSDIAGGTSEILQGATAEGAIMATGKFVKASWASDETSRQCGENCQSLSEVIESVREGLTEKAMAKTKSAMSFLEVLAAFRSAGKDTILQALQDVNNVLIAAQLFDVLAATQTPSSLEVIKEVVDFTREDADVKMLERFLLTMAYNNHPTEEQISWLLNTLRDDNLQKDIRATIALTAAKLVNSYQHLHTGNTEIVNGVIDWLLAGVTSEDRFHKILCLNALKNAVQPSSIDAILSVAENDKDMDVVEVALDALLKFEPKYFTPEVNSVLNNIIHEGSRAYSTVTRSLAATLLLSNTPSMADVVSLVRSLRSSKQEELALFVLEKIVLISQGTSSASETIRDAMSDPEVSNYYTTALSGKSVAFNSVFFETDDVAINFGLDLQMTPSGLLRKSDFNVGLDTKNESLLLLNVGIFSRGLEYFFGENAGDTGDATAGLNIECMDMKLRMLVFFTGTGELMSMAWNMGSSDEAIPHMRVIGLIQDHSQTLRLQSGFDVDVSIHGSISLDLGGTLDFSLWDRASTTIVSTAGSIGVKGSTQINTPFIKTGIDYSGRGSTVVNFVTSVQFTSLPPASCLQLMSEPLIYIKEDTRYEQLERSETKFESSARQRFKIREHSFKLFDKNSGPCHGMFGQDEEEEGGWW